MVREFISFRVDILEYPEKQYFKDKVATCDFLCQLADSLQTVPDLLIGYEANIIKVLEDTVSNRVLKVQQAARKAVKKWKEFEQLYEIIEEKKSIIDVELAGLTLEEIFHIRTGLEDTTNERVSFFLQNKVQSLYANGPRKSITGPGGDKISFGLNDKMYELPRKASTKEK